MHITHIHMHTHMKEAKEGVLYPGTESGVRSSL